MELYTPEALITEDEISLRIQALGNAITKDFEDEDLDVICGAFLGL